MSALDEACEQWLNRLLAAATPLSSTQFDVIRRTCGSVRIDDALDLDAAEASAA